MYDQTVKQNTSIAAQTSTKSSAGVTTRYRLNAWPLTLSYAYNLYSDNSQKQVTSITQGLSENQLTTRNGWPIYFSTMEVSENPGDTLLDRSERRSYSDEPDEQRALHLLRLEHMLGPHRKSQRRNADKL